ncbi:MAG: hypothetical protein ABJA35_05910 [Parafilimonas sp.]
MKKCLFVFIVMIIGITSCQKGITDVVDTGNTGGDNNGGDTTVLNALKGSWNFTSVSANTQNSVEFTIDGETDKSLSVTNYTSQNNSGTLVIDDSMFQMNNYTYTIDTSIETYTYINDILSDSINVPFTYYVPATNSSAKYHLIGTDSVYFPEGGFISSSSDSTAFKPYGLKFSITGNILKFTQNIHVDTTVVQSGITQHETATGTGTLLFQKP